MRAPKLQPLGLRDTQALTDFSLRADVVEQPSNASLEALGASNGFASGRRQGAFTDDRFEVRAAIPL
jgi:hypothetical protein